jgi:hypothetical protein
MTLKGRRRKKSSDFQPSRDNLSLAVQEYLEKGGKITRLEVDDTQDPERKFSDQFSPSFENTILQ